MASVRVLSPEPRNWARTGDTGFALKIPVDFGGFFAGESDFALGLGLAFVFVFAAGFLVDPAVTAVLTPLEEESTEEVALEAGARSDLHPLKTKAATEDILSPILVFLSFSFVAKKSVCVILENLGKFLGEKGLTFWLCHASTFEISNLASFDCKSFQVSIILDEIRKDESKLVKKIVKGISDHLVSTSLDDSEKLIGISFHKVLLQSSKWSESG